MSQSKLTRESITKQLSSEFDNCKVLIKHHSDYLTANLPASAVIEKPAEEVKTEDTSEPEEKKEEAPSKEEPQEKEGSTEVSEDKPETKE